jgi:DsbC/DsbD-like thiol-disulfide interchange protein
LISCRGDRSVVSLWVALLLATLTPIGALVAGEPFEDDPSENAEPARARLITDVTAFAAGSTFRLGVLFTIDEHWHLYWHSARDGGLNTTVEWLLPEGWRAGPISWPAPSRFVDPGSLVAYGYEKEVLLVSEITIPEDFSQDGAVTLGADLSWLVCEELCLIGEAKPTLALSRGAPRPSSEVKRFEAWRAKVPLSPSKAGISVDERFDAENAKWRVALTWPEGSKAPTAKEIRAYPFDVPGSRLDEGRIETEGRRAVFTFQVRIDNDEFRAERLGVVIVWTPSEGSQHAVRIVRRDP